jgi:hypothetical protein
MRVCADPNLGCKDTHAQGQFRDREWPRNGSAVRWGIICPGKGSNRVTDNVRLTDNVMQDPDANEYVTNRIRGNLICHGDSPAPQVGDSGGQPTL